MRLKKILLFIIISIFCFMPVVNAKNDIIIKNIKPVEVDENVVLNSKSSINAIFNDLGQTVKYKVTLQNNTKKDLYVNSLEVIGSSQNFMNYILDNESRSTTIKANGKSDIYLTVEAGRGEQAGKNLNDIINFKFFLNNEIKNPATSSNLLSTIILVIISAVAITFVMTKFNNKKGTIATVIVCFVLLGTSFVFADDTIIVKTVGKVSYVSQNLLETTGTLISDRVANYTSSKDVWAYSNKIKNINIKAELNSPEIYVKSFDLTTDNNFRVVAYLVENGDSNVPYDLYINSNGVIYAPEDSTGLFSFQNVEKINGLENVIFDNTTSMKGMFFGNQVLSNLDVSKLNMSKVFDTSYMFYMCYNLNLSKNDFDLTKVSTDTDMFSNYLYDVISKNPTSDEGMNFNKNSSAGVYLVDSSKDSINPIYYYRGNVTNNYVKIGNTCWRMVRTTETGGIKLVYSSISSGTYCSSTSGVIADSPYSENLTGVNSVSYVTDSGQDSLVKRIVDNWYEKNMLNYSFLLEDAVWYMDRKVYAQDGSEFYGAAHNRIGAGTSETANAKPSNLSAQDSDKLTVVSGKLKYPIALLTADELVYSGGIIWWGGATTYLDTGTTSWWTMTPHVWTTDGAGQLLLWGNDKYSNTISTNSKGVRPAVSLIGNVDYISGNGSNSNPYIINTRENVYIVD